MRLAKPAKRAAKGWVNVKVVKRAGKTATTAVRRRRRGPSTAQKAGRIAAGVGIAGALAFVLAKIDRRKAVGRAKGAVHSAAAATTGGRDYDDVTLARKVETELFRPADVPKGLIAVNVVDGVVELRGELPDQARIDALGDTARKVSGVRDVRNLLHTGTNGD